MGRDYVTNNSYNDNEQTRQRVGRYRDKPLKK